MTRAAICLIALLSIPLAAQDNKPLRLSDLTATYNGPLVFVDGRQSVVVTCQAAGSDPEDYYDCKLGEGHNLDDVVRLAMRELKMAQEERDADRKEELRLLKRWQKMFEDIKKELPQPVPQNNKSKS